MWRLALAYHAEIYSGPGVALCLFVTGYGVQFQTRRVALTLGRRVFSSRLHREMESVVSQCRPYRNRKDTGRAVCSSPPTHTHTRGLSLHI